MLNSPLTILYQDDYLVAVYKPAGLLVHRTGLAAGEEAGIALQQVRAQTGRYVYPLHRLDRPTAGVLLFAFDVEAARRLKDAFTQRQVEKRYLAVTRGWILAPVEIDHPLKKGNLSRQERRRLKAGALELVAKPAETRVEPLAITELPHAVGPYQTARYTLLAAYPRTGRTHQIRRHLAHIAHPIVGDTRYGDTAHNRFFRRVFNWRRLLLLAQALRFSHPLDGSPLTISAEPDTSWVDLMARLDWRPLADQAQTS